MFLQKYFPSRIGDQVVWLRNLKTKLPAYDNILGLAAGDVTAFLLDVDNAIYALGAYRGAIATFPDAAYKRISDALHDETLAGTITWLDLTLPAPAPAAVSYGCLQRVFTYINDVIREAAAYTEAIGEDLGLVLPDSAAPPTTSYPEFTLRMNGDKMEVVWPKGIFDGVKLDFDLGAGVKQSDIDLRPNYTLNWLPPAGTSAIIKVRLRYILKGEEFGIWSPWQQWTLTGA